MAEIMNRVAPIVNSAQRSRADAHALLDACLDLIRFADHAGEEAETAAREIGKALVFDALGWTEPEGPMTARDWNALLEDPIAWRLEAIVRLSRAPTPIPWRLVLDLTDGLAGLQKGDGVAPAHLQPTPKVHWGRGSNPRDARECEEMILCWIAWQCGKGREPTELSDEVAQAVHRTRKTVEAWRVDWKSRAGAQAVERELAYWRRRGKEGKEFSSRPISLADMAALWLVARDPGKT